MAISLPRICRISLWDNLVRSLPPKRIDPLTILPGASTNPITAREVTLLPHPDSPTRPTTSPSLTRSEEHTSELQSRENIVCRLLLEKKKDIAFSSDCKNTANT